MTECHWHYLCKKRNTVGGQKQLVLRVTLQGTWSFLSFLHMELLLAFFFFKIFSRTLVLFVGPLTLLVWTSGDICPGFQSQGGFSCLHALSPQIDLWRDTCWPLGGQHGSWAIPTHILTNKHWWGSSSGSIVPLPHSVRLDLICFVHLKLIAGSF